MAISICFFLEDTDYSFVNRMNHKQWLRKMIRVVKPTEGGINIVLCSDKYLLEMNKKYLSKKELTDVIAFENYQDGRLAGDVFISIDRVKENAVKYNVSTEEELRRVMAHGILHILGFKDKTVADKKKMTEMEDFCLSIY
ncbi:MAG: rRNA maturation RNase YbeY [Bacteroidetes bacterium]|nr:rRNA maturation RNase YbeY [Bacteroidota bacterium]MBU1721071.1 rRNA maturation RNase YbeY [Bacteroidota bacterium]